MMEPGVAKASRQQSDSASISIGPTQPDIPPVYLERALPIAVAAVAAISWYLWGQVRKGKQQRRVRSPGSSEFDAALEVSFKCH